MGGAGETCPAGKTPKGAVSQELQAVAPRSWKRLESRSSPEPPDGSSTADTSILTP